MSRDDLAKLKAAQSADRRQQRNRRGRRVNHRTTMVYRPGMGRLPLGPVSRNGHACTLGDVSELPLEDVPGVAAPAHEAAGGQVVYITERGERVAAIVPAEVAAVLERLSADELERLSAAAANAGLRAMAGLLEDLADRAAVLESRADPGPGIPWEQVKAEAGL
jgi:antitoxin (DNA-binding transcriptional repressor) of toxin-antitoxin stability system